MYVEVPSPPYDILTARTTSSVSIQWQHHDVCFSNITFEIRILQDGRYLIGSHDNITIEGLVPNTTYTIVIGAVGGGSVQVMVTTLGGLLWVCIR